MADAQARYTSTLRLEGEVLGIEWERQMPTRSEEQSGDIIEGIEAGTGSRAGWPGGLRG
jgi:hypothetical protein